MQQKIIGKGITGSWNNYLGMFAPEQRDIYFTEEYLRLNAAAGEQARAFVYTEGDKVMLFPFLAREHETCDGVKIRDFETAYGYGGPIYNTDDDAFIKKALIAFKNEMADEGYLAGFIRFHPMLDNQRYFDMIGDVIYDRKTIAINLSAPIDDVWMNEIHTKNRNVIKKGSKEGLTFTADYEYKSLDRFKNLYTATMDKLGADSFYYFSDEYFHNFKKLFPRSFIGCVNFENEIIAAAIFFFDGIYGHYHLAGSNINLLSLSPNNFMLWEAAKELKKRGVKRFHLGGGMDSDESNSLFQFKRKFSKNTCDFYIGKLIFDNNTYIEVCRRWEERNPDKAAHYGNRLLKYRY